MTKINLHVLPDSNIKMERYGEEKKGYKLK